MPLSRQPEGQQKVRPDPDGLPAKTVFTTLQRFRGATLLEAELLTGRTHQIRVHAAASGWPVAGDDRYGERRANGTFRRAGLQRLFLHSHHLEFDVADGERILAHAPIPTELREVLDQYPK